MDEKETSRFQEQEQEKETGRIEAFSDGVFAVAITLLILNIQVPAKAQVLQQAGNIDIALSKRL